MGGAAINPVATPLLNWQLALWKGIHFDEPFRQNLRGADDSSWRRLFDAWCYRIVRGISRFLHTSSRRRRSSVFLGLEHVHYNDQTVENEATPTGTGSS